MKAIVQDGYGTADLLELRDIDPPAIAADEVLVRVRAAGVDRGVWHLMTGLPYPIRLAGYGLRAPKRSTPGGDLAGVVEAIGSDVTRFQPGDEVFGIGVGTFAELARARADKLTLKPPGLTFEQASAIPVSGLTALQAVRDHARVERGQSVLVLGASGGVGSFAVQIAAAFGGEVTGVCGPSKVDLVRSLGAAHVIDYTDSDFADGARAYDVIIDTGGNATLARLRRALAPRGRLVIVGGETGGTVLGGFDRGFRAAALSPFVSQSLMPMMCDENHADLDVLAELVESGAVTPAVDRAFALVDAPQAIRYLEQGRTRGKVVVTV